MGISSSLLGRTPQSLPTWPARATGRGAWRASPPQRAGGPHRLCGGAGMAAPCPGLTPPLPAPPAVAPRQPRTRLCREGPFWRRLRESPLSGVSLQDLSRVAVCPVGVMPGERGPEAGGGLPLLALGWGRGPGGSHAVEGAMRSGQPHGRPWAGRVPTSPQSSESGVASGQTGQRLSVAGTCVLRAPGRPAGGGSPELHLEDGGPALPRVPGSPSSASHHWPPASSAANLAPGRGAWVGFISCGVRVRPDQKPTDTNSRLTKVSRDRGLTGRGRG